MAQTTKQLAGNQRRSLRATRAKLLAMADEWEDLDEYHRSELISLADQCEQVAAQMVEEPAP